MHDVVIRNGTVYDGEGGAPYAADVAIDGDLIAAVMPAIGDRGRREIDVSGLAVAPGLISVLSWATPPLFADGRAQSDVRQGVTLEVFGEGSSMGPLTDAMRREQIERQADIKYDIPWTTLREGLDHLVRLGISVNVASFVGATTLRVHEVGYDDRPPGSDELERMRRLAREAAAEGALGLGSALIYTPGTFAATDELAALAEAAGGTYISHLRNEGERLVEAIDELIEIARTAGVRGEIYHLKQAGTPNWSKLPAVIKRVKRARAGGVDITADMYPYTAGATCLNACMPPWVQARGSRAELGRLREPSLRERVADEMRAAGPFARLLGRYVRDEGIVPLEEAIRRLTSFPATNLGLDRRGRLARGYFADVVAFDPNKVIDHATYADPHRYASGVVDVFVNGEQVLRRV